MLLIIIQDPRERAFVISEFALVLGLVLLLLGFLFYYPFMKKKFEYKYGTKRNNIFGYINDAFKILTYHRSLGLIFMGIFLILLSIFFFILGLFK